MSNEEKFAGFKERHLDGAGLQRSVEGLVGGFTLSKPIHSSPVMGMLGHLFLLNARQMVKGTSRACCAGARGSAGRAGPGRGPA